MRRATGLQVGLAALMCGASLVIGATAGIAADDTRSELRVNLDGNGTAQFWTTHTLNGTPDGRISCRREAGVTTGTCSTKYTITITLTVYYVLYVAPGSGTCPKDPNAPCTGGGLYGSFPMSYNTDRDVDITVKLQHPTVLNVTRSGTGMGTVTSDPPGIDCGADCWGEFPDGRDVTLSVAWDPDSKFVGWSGACVATTPTCTFNLDTASTVDAKFDLVVPPTPSPNPTAAPTAPPTAAPVASASTRTAVPATPAMTQGDDTPTEPPVSGAPTDLPGAGSPSAGSPSAPPPSAGPVAVGGSDASAGPEPAGGGAAGPAPGEVDPAAGDDGFLAGLFVSVLVGLVVIIGAVGAWLWRRRSPPVAS